jgi:branched-chain amino acid transport system permease protein
MRIGRVYILVGVLAVIWLVLPQVLPRHWTDLLAFCGIYAIAGLGIGFLVGQCGIVNLAQAMFYGIGAYASAYATVVLGYPSLVGIIAGLAVSMLTAFAVGWPILRLTGYFLALATLALAIIGNVLFLEWDWLTGGTLGVGGIPKLSLFGFALDTPARFYYFIWPLAGLAALMVHNLSGNGRIGLALRAMRDAPDAARVLSVDIHTLRTKAFVLCAALGSLAGSMFAHYVTFVSVQSFTIERSIVFLLIPVLGGSMSVIGTFVGALIITLIPEFLSKLGDAHQILFGLTLVGIVTLMPEGLSKLLQLAAARFNATSGKRGVH